MLVLPEGIRCPFFTVIPLSDLLMAFTVLDVFLSNPTTEILELNK